LNENKTKKTLSEYAAFSLTDDPKKTKSGVTRGNSETNDANLEHNAWHRMMQQNEW
jgi:hypothetical protein